VAELVRPEKSPDLGGMGAKMPPMTDLSLRPTGNRTQFEVIANGRIIGRIAMFSTGRNRSRPWLWSIELPFREGR
jgi:hypothetical protein